MQNYKSVKNCKLQVATCSFRVRHVCLHLVSLMNIHLHDTDIFFTGLSKAMHFLTVQLYTRVLSVTEGEGKYTLLYLCFNL